MAIALEMSLLDVVRPGVIRAITGQKDIFLLECVAHLQSLSILLRVDGRDRQTAWHEFAEMRADSQRWLRLSH